MTDAISIEQYLRVNREKYC